MADKEITIKVTTETDAKQLDDLKEVITSIENTNVVIEVESDNTQINETYNSVEELKEAFTEATSQVDELQQELANIEMGESDANFDEISTQLDEATTNAETLGEALSQMDTNGLTNATTDADDLSNSLTDATTNANELSDSMGLIESTMLMDMANQIGALGDSAEGMAQDMNTASISVGQLSTNVGMAEPQMISLINNISNATFPQEEAIAYANALNQMGVSADQLGSAATNMDLINDATGIGYTKVMQLTQGLQAVGVSANNLPASFNAIAFAQANVNGGADTLTMVLKRQAATINEYGLSVDQLVVIMQALSAQGVQGMKMGSELSKVLKANNGDLKAIEQQLGLTSGALTNATATTSKYTGQLQKLADEEAAHKTIIDHLNAAWEDMSLALAPVLSPLGSLVGLIGQFGQTAMAINSILTLTETFGLLKTATIGQTVSNYALAVSEWLVASPILILVAVILVLIGVLGYLYFNNEQVRNAINGLGQAFINLGQWIYNGAIYWLGQLQVALSNLWNYILTLGGLIPANVDLTGNQILDTIIRVMLFVATLPFQLATIFMNAIAKTLGFGDNFVQTMIRSAVNAVTGFANGIANLSSALAQELQSMISEAINFMGRIGGILWQAGVNAITGFLNGIQRHSPGIMQREFRAELTEMTDFVPEQGRKLTGNIKTMARDMTGSFTGLNNADLDLNTADIDFANKNSNTKFDELISILKSVLLGNFTVNVYGDVDNEARVNMIVETIRKELNWNNSTAGRSKSL